VNARCVMRCLWAVPLFGQSAAAPPLKLAFDVADVQADKSWETRMAIDFQAGGRLSMHNVPMKVLIMFAYHLRAGAISGGPGWIESERFDIVAKAAQTTRPDEMRRMLQTLLAERFRLVVHTDQKVMPAYALVAGKSGPKMQRLPASEAALLTDQRCAPAEGEPGHRRVVCRHLTMAALADTLQELSPRDFDVPVVDQTGLEGVYDFQLDWAPSARPADVSADVAAGPTIFDAVAGQLGLKLERTRLPLPAIVVDSLERTPIDR
jgi:uncharacterized protein (TIGR03435 family)